MISKMKNILSKQLHLTWYAHFDKIILKFSKGFCILVFI